MRAVDLALYADTLAAEAAALSARAERCRLRLRQATIERQARRALRPEIVARLDALGVFAAPDELSTREEIRDLSVSLAALRELQVCVESCLAAAEDPGGGDGWGAETIDR
jgi:hypothetical protein